MAALRFVSLSNEDDIMPLYDVHAATVPGFKMCTFPNDPYRLVVFFFLNCCTSIKVSVCGSGSVEKVVLQMPQWKIED